MPAIAAREVLLAGAALLAVIGGAELLAGAVATQDGWSYAAAALGCVHAGVLGAATVAAGRRTMAAAWAPALLWPLAGPAPAAAAVAALAGALLLATRLRARGRALAGALAAGALAILVGAATAAPPEAAIARPAAQIRAADPAPGASRAAERDTTRATHGANDRDADAAGANDPAANDPDADDHGADAGDADDPGATDPGDDAPTARRRGRAGPGRRRAGVLPRARRPPLRRRVAVPLPRRPRGLRRPGDLARRLRHDALEPPRRRDGRRGRRPRRRPPRPDGGRRDGLRRRRAALRAELDARAPAGRGLAGDRRRRAGAERRPARCS